MVSRLLFDPDLSRSLRSNFSYETMSSSYPYTYSDDSFWDFCKPSTAHLWSFTLVFIAAVLGIFTSIVYLVLVIRHFNELASNFLFLNNFLLASFISLLRDVLVDVVTYRSYCWYAGRLLCKALRILGTSENAMIFFLVAIILEQNHPYVHSFLSKNTKFRKRTTTIVLWLVAIVFSIPEVFFSDLSSYGSGRSPSFCGFSQFHHGLMYLHKVIFLEYLVPLLLLIVTLAHAAAVLSRRSNPPIGDQVPEVNYSRNDENEQQQEATNLFPPIRVTSVAIGVIFFLMKTPRYLTDFLFVFFHLLPRILYECGFVLYPIPSTVAPVVVLFSSPIHKKRLKETYQSIASCIAGRRVKKGFLLSSGDEEEKLEEIDVESEPRD